MRGRRTRCCRLQSSALLPGRLMLLSRYWWNHIGSSVLGRERESEGERGRGRRGGKEGLIQCKVPAM